ncbi:hypothetical protein QN277_023040 [Acacia crassicarpa]|uniref:F-box domain-containing protein n=1 Tax=Acacia crassicarpa TaxID=499986 RepID=A0AAE1MQA1_9FABA|nr:hypothetical protein QN277_023040 [Acacia crassicarpa]
MSDHHLPPEIVSEILYRLPVKSLVKFTSVCKAWNSLITDQTFIYDHLNRTIQASNGNNFLFFHVYFHEFRGRRRHLRMHNEYFYSMYSVNKQTNHPFLERLPFSHLFQDNRWPLFVSTCNGLVCLADCFSPLHFFLPLDYETMLIWNPLLRKYLVLPKPIKTFKEHERFEYSLYFGFGFDSRNNDYKVIRFMNHRSTQDTPHVEVYSLVSCSWRSITVRVPHFHLGKYNGLRASFVKGAVHWVVSRRRIDGLEDTFILSFDVTEETFQELTLPRQLGESEWIHSILIDVEGGHLLVIVNRRYRNQQLVYNVWVMKEYGIAESWTELFEFDHSHYGGISKILALTRSGKVVMELVGGAIVLVDPIKELLEPIEHPAACGTTSVRSYVESLFFINKEPGVFSF